MQAIGASLTLGVNSATLTDLVYALVPVLSVGLALWGAACSRPGFLVASAAVLSPFVVCFMGCPRVGYVVAGVGMLVFPPLRRLHLQTLVACDLGSPGAVRGPVSVGVCRDYLERAGLV